MEDARLGGGGEFFVRYVPQSRFFHPYELATDGFSLSPQDVERLNEEPKVSITQSLSEGGQKALVVS